MRPTTIELVSWTSGGAFVGTIIQLFTDGLFASAALIVALALGMLAGQWLWMRFAPEGWTLPPLTKLGDVRLLSSTFTADRTGGRGDHVEYGHRPDVDADTAHTLYLHSDLVTDMEDPRRITVTVRPGDHLNGGAA